MPLENPPDGALSAAPAAGHGRPNSLRRTPVLLALAALLLGLAGCTSTGTGAGHVSNPGSADEPVAFAWSSTDGAISGVLRASSAGAKFQGRFFQITQQTRSELLQPLWTYWGSGWQDWPYRGRRYLAPVHATQFVTHYSGMVVASLEAGGDLRMRCRFHLVDPARGMSGGGEGECQRSDGRLVHAVFAGD